MSPTITLLSLACIISNQSPIDTTNVEAKLSMEDKIQVQQYIDSEICLPQNLESLLAETREKMNRGDATLRSIGNNPAPSEACF